MKKQKPPCPKCGANTRVVDSRWSSPKQAVRRRRSCPDCGLRFTTYELIAAIKSLSPRKVASVSQLRCDDAEGSALRKQREQAWVRESNLYVRQANRDWRRFIDAVERIWQ